MNPVNRIQLTGRDDPMISFSRFFSRACVSALALLLATSASWAADAPTADEIAKKAYLAFFYAGTDFKVRVNMKLIDKDGKQRARELTMLRTNLQEGGDQKYFIYFHQPTDVKDMTFLVYKYLRKDDDRWLFIPAVRLVKRIASSDKRSSFVGSDFTYEDISGRDLEDDTYKLLREETLNNQPVYVLESTPKDPKGANYARKISYISTESFLPLKEEYHDLKGNVVKIFTADEVQRILPRNGKGPGYWTVTKRTMTDLGANHRTEVMFTRIEYDLGVPDDVFTERSLRTPPQKYLN